MPDKYNINRFLLLIMLTAGVVIFAMAFFLNQKKEETFPAEITALLQSADEEAGKRLLYDRAVINFSGENRNKHTGVIIRNITGENRPLRKVFQNLSGETFNGWAFMFLNYGLEEKNKLNETGDFLQAYPPSRFVFFNQVPPEGYYENSNLAIPPGATRVVYIRTGDDYLAVDPRDSNNNGINDTLESLIGFSSSSVKGMSSSYALNHFSSSSGLTSSWSSAIVVLSSKSSNISYSYSSDIFSSKISSSQKFGSSSSSNIATSCGNGIIENSENCDDGSVCVHSNTGERIADGNGFVIFCNKNDPGNCLNLSPEAVCRPFSGDGCSDGCEIENNWMCIDCALSQNECRGNEPIGFLNPQSLCNSCIDTDPENDPYIFGELTWNTGDIVLGEQQWYSADDCSSGQWQCDEEYGFAVPLNDNLNVICDNGCLNGICQ